MKTSTLWKALWEAACKPRSLSICEQAANGSYTFTVQYGDGSKYRVVLKKL